MNSLNNADAVIAIYKNKQNEARQERKAVVCLLRRPTNLN